MGKATLDEQIANGKAKLTGNRQPYDELKSMLVQFRPDFEILPGTAGTSPAAPADRNAFEQLPDAIETGHRLTKRVTHEIDPFRRDDRVLNQRLVTLDDVVAIEMVSSRRKFPGLAVIQWRQT